MSLIEATQAYWALNRSTWSAGMHRLPDTPIHQRMLEIARNFQGKNLGRIIERVYAPKRSGLNVGGSPPA